MTDYERCELRQKLAKRLYDYMDPWEREYKTEYEIFCDVVRNPELIIEYLLDQLEE